MGLSQKGARSEVQNTQLTNKRILLPKQLKFQDDSKYKVVDFLGKGGYAVVVSAQKVENSDDEQSQHSGQKIVAIKAVIKNRFDNFKSEKLNNYAKREVEIMNKLDHENILKLYNHFQDDNYIYLLLELCDNKTLSHIIKGDNPVTNQRIKQFLFDIAKGCQYMHQNLVVHRDLKPDNILLNQDCSIKIADFGLAVCLQNADELLFTFCGTPKYQAPEMIKNKGYSFNVDIWALGCITYRLFYGNAPFEGTSADEIYKATLSKSVKYSRISKSNYPVNKNEIQVMRSLLQKDPSKRITLNELLENNSKFFEYLDSYSLESISSSTSSLSKAVPNTSGGKYDQMISCLKAIAHYDKNKRVRLNYISYHDYKLAPTYYVQQWIEINMYGFGYLVSKDIFAFNFKDQSKMILKCNELFYCSSKNVIINFSDEQCPSDLHKKLSILRQAQIILKRSRYQLDTETTDDIQPKDCPVVLPWLHKWVETLQTIVFQFNSKQIQIDFRPQKTSMVFNPHNNSFTLLNHQKKKMLSLSLDFILNEHVTDRMQKYISTALQYIELL